MMIVEHFIKTLRSSAIYNPDIQVAPACILWPDRERQWEAIIPRLQQEMPELLVLGDYSPEKRVGPAIWLRCIIGAACLEITLPANKTPIFYLPGVGRQDLRAVQECPEHLKPLAELQYRGAIWSQLNSKDWTILAFLKSEQGGLGLDVAQDKVSKNAMQVALHQLLDEDLQLLQNRHLDKDYFNKLLSGDPVRDFLQWLTQEDLFKNNRGENEWRAFVSLCKSQFGFDPDNDGILTGVEKMALHEGPWLPVWLRFCEAPKRYPNIPDLIRKCTMPVLKLFSDVNSHGSWPQWNEAQERQLQEDLLKLDKLPPHKVRDQILSLEARHGARRDLIWVELGASPLATALKHLTQLAEITANSPAAGTIYDMRDGYCHSGWQADDAVLKALTCVDSPVTLEAVTVAIRSMYMSWLEESSRYLQHIVEQDGYPGERSKRQVIPAKKGECLLFVDGLRFDVAKRLKELLSETGLSVGEKIVWAALPSVTATGKPAVSPVGHLIAGKESMNFEPCIAETGQLLTGGNPFKKLLLQNGWQVLSKAEAGDNTEFGWAEFGDIDHEGHNRGWKLAKYVDGLLVEVADRVQQLLAGGWGKIRIITDHGWLLLPGGLPKVDLPKFLTENKWGRCATLKAGAESSGKLFPWYWDNNIHFALADGICCFKKGEEYTHGGLSLQECLVLELSVVKDTTLSGAGSVELTDITWKGLRCKVAVDGSDFTGCFLDIRLHAGNKSSSIVMNVRPVNKKGMASVVVEDEDLEDNDAQVVILDDCDHLLCQVATIVGGKK